MSPTKTANGVARAISIVGHPVILMPLAAAIAAPPDAAAVALVTALACAGLVLADSLRKVRRGEWAHVDASAPGERAQLNLRVGLGLLLAAVAVALAGVHPGIPLVVGLSALIVLAGQVFRRVGKLSLHVAFAVFAAGLAWPDPAAVGVFVALAFAVGWSRLVLARHVGRDLALGGLVGAAAGVALHGMLAGPGA